ncbi:MAG: choice-of-anchor K domain-containing protein [Aulosira sp. DedQUE10]|nr:choice-of-anchor K domain-containing protein [Aulosira sp. DedQUE10]
MATLNFLTKLSLAITATTALVFFASSANALTLNSASGTWSKPVGGSNIKYQNVKTDTALKTDQTLTKAATKNQTYTTNTTTTTVTKTTTVTTNTTDATTGKTSTTSITSQPTTVSNVTSTPQIINNTNNTKNSTTTTTTTLLSTNTATSTSTENQVRWGQDVGNGQSGLGFQGASNLTFDLNQVFQIGTLTHYNNAIAAGTAASKVDLGLNLNFSGLSTASKTFNFSFNVDETPNVGDVSKCPYYSITACSDKITFSTPKNVNTFSIAGVDYTLQMVGFSETANSTPMTQFISQEGGNNSAYLYAKITAVPPRRVPESSSGLGVLAFGALAASSMLNQKQRVKATVKV